MWTALVPLAIAVVTLLIEWLKKRNVLSEQEYHQTMGAMNVALERVKLAKQIDADAGNLSDDWLSPTSKQSGTTDTSKKGDSQ